MLTRKLPNRWQPALALAFSIAAICMMLSGTASAQTWNRKTAVTFSHPVEIPGVGAQVLPAGTYVFRLLDSLSDRHIVQIFNQDETHIYATILAIPNSRLKATDQTVITFDERPAGDPQAIRAWFYPGDLWGQEFVYPRTRAVELARATNEPVLYIPDEIASNITAPVRTITEPPAIALIQTPFRAVAPDGGDIALAEVVIPPPVLAASLPKTAGNLPLLALIGCLFLTAGFSLKALNTLCAR